MRVIFDSSPVHKMLPGSSISDRDVIYANACTNGSVTVCEKTFRAQRDGCTSFSFAVSAEKYVSHYANEGRKLPT